MGLSNDQYNRILREYDDRRQQAKREQTKRTEEVYRRIPELADIDRQIASGSVDAARQALFGDTDTLDILKKQNEQRSLRKRELLQHAGFPADYLQMQYHCPDCQDTGLIAGQKCHCFKQAIVDCLYHQSGRKQALEKENFSTFCLDYYSKEYIDSSIEKTPYDNAVDALNICRRFIDSFDTTPGNLLIYGNTGMGKTFLANCVAKELLDQSHTVIYLTAFELFDVMEKYAFHSHDEQDAESMLGYILDCDLLIIDDLGTELSNSFVNSRLYLCLNERQLRHKSTLISTNLSLEDLSRTYSERIFSRLISDYTTIKMVGEDIRLKKAFQ